MSKLSQAKTIREYKKEDKKWYSLNQDDILKKLETSKFGLDQEEVKKRQEKYGLNKLPEVKKESKLSIFLRQFKSSLVYVLLVASIISFLLGDLVDAGVIMLAILINVVIGFYQENKAQMALAALKKIVVNRCKVLRHNHEQEIDTLELVPGDIVALDAGDKIPGDLRLLKINNLRINEAPLTGESVEVRKSAEILSGDLILADQTNMAFMGTEVTQGSAWGVVVETGAGTAIGKIAGLVASTEELITPLQRKLNIFARKISLLILLLTLLIFLVGLILGYNFIQIFVTAVAIAVSAIPEGLLVVVTMILAVGMQRILKKKALVKHLLAAEILGSTSVVCADKTGTITEGEMRVVELATLEYNFNLLHHDSKKNKLEAEELITLLTIGMFCNNAYIENPEEELEHRIVRGSPTEKALLLAGANIGLDKYELEKTEPRLDEIPFDSKWKFMMTLNKGNKNFNTIYIKGAPEVLLDFSRYTYSNRAKNKKQEMNSAHKKKMVEIYEDMSRRGLRVLAMGYQKVNGLVKNLKAVENDFIFVGFAGVKDPIRSGIKETLGQVKQAGIRTIMITGDHQLTAQAIAKELGLPSQNKNIMSGQALAGLKESELMEVVDKISVYARVTPEDKLKIVKAWQKKGQIVAMTGDGINDAPALKKANIGIAVGSGTDVAKEIADTILLDNNFKTIIAAIKEGRVIYDNIRKVILYFLSDSFAEVLTVTTALFLGWPLPILAAQIIWTNLIDDTFPALAISREPADKDIMKQKPRNINEPILDRENKLLIGLISFLSALGTLFFFYLFWTKFNNIDMARTVGFSFLSLSTLIYVFSIRSLNKPVWEMNILSNKFLLAAVFLGFCLQLLAIYNPFLQKIFKTVPLALEEWLLLILGCFILLIIIESVKAIYYKKRKTKNL
jgi:Ca2+-transporting ATPase